MTNDQKLILHKYKDLSQVELVITILQVAKIRKQILFNSSILDLCEYLTKLEETFGEIKKCQIKM